MNVVIREANRSDISALKDKLREADHKEVIAAGNSSDEEALTQSFDRSTICFCVDIDGNQAALFGLVPDSLIGESANVWFLGTSEMSRMKKTFVKASRGMIANFLVYYPVLWNAVDCRYVSSIRWLRFCGAVFNRPAIRSGDTHFLPFVIRRA